MPDVSPERIRIIAGAARIPIAPESAERVAAAVTPAVDRISEANLALPLEIEPASFMAVQQRETGR
jgi:hypothetical protein